MLGAGPHEVRKIDTWSGNSASTRIVGSVALMPWSNALGRASRQASVELPAPTCRPHREATNMAVCPSGPILASGTRGFGIDSQSCHPIQLELTYRHGCLV